MMKHKANFLLLTLLLSITSSLFAVGGSGMYQYSVTLTNYISKETGKAPTAYLWISEGCEKVKAVMVGQSAPRTQRVVSGSR